MRGRKPKPTQLRIVGGVAGHRPLNRKEPKPTGDLAEPPEDLPDQAKVYWREAIEGAPKGMLKNLDRRTLAVWATAAWLHNEASQRLGKSTMLVKTPNGAVVQSPYLAIVNRQATIKLKAASELGFTPSARTRLSIDDDREDDDWSEFK